MSKYVEKTRDEALEDLYKACLTFRHSGFYDNVVERGIILRGEIWAAIDGVIHYTRDIEDVDLHHRVLYKSVEE